MKEYTMNKTVIRLTALALVLASMGFSAFAADSDYETKNGWEVNMGRFSNPIQYDGLVITKYTGWDTEVEIPAKIGGKAVLAIGEGAFKGASLTRVTIPEGVTYIGKGAFRDNKLTSITIPASVRTIEGGSGEYDHNGAFDNNQITEVVFPEGVEKIGRHAFRGNKITSVTLPASLMEFGGFDAAPGTANLGANITTTLKSALGDNIFYNYIANDRKAGAYTAGMKCEKKTADDYTYYATEYGAVLTKYNGSSERIRVPAEIEGIPVKALSYEGYYSSYGVYYAKDITQVLIPEGITYIGSGAFNNNKLTSVAIPATVTYIGEEAFLNLTDGGQIASLTLNAGLLYIGDSAFRKNKLTGLTIPGTVKHIGSSAFRDNQLTSLTVPSGVRYIGGDAFNGNPLTKITIAEGVTYIGADAFSGGKLKTLTLPKSLTTLRGFPLAISYDELLFAPGSAISGVIVIGAGVTVESRNADADFDFGTFYYKNGRKAGSYSYTMKYSGGSGFKYSAK
jgi:hypothetical protein